MKGLLFLFVAREKISVTSSVIPLIYVVCFTKKGTTCYFQTNNIWSINVEDENDEDVGY